MIGTCSTHGVDEPEKVRKEATWMT